MQWMRQWRRRLRVLVRRDAVERELDEELAFHLEMETRKNVREGMEPAEARRQASIAFGGVEAFKEEVREARALGWVSGISLDLKLGVRMLAKYPGLALVGGLAMAFAIAVGAAGFEFVRQMVSPSLPLDEGGRIVGIRHVDAEGAGLKQPTAADFYAWRGSLSSVRDLGAFRTLEPNLDAGGRSEPVQVAEMTASGFGVARVAPLLGRTLVGDDERAAAPPVVVLGHDAWRARFGGDPGAVGRTVRLDGVEHTVVGVMPEGFAFPVSHDLWVSLRADPAILAGAPGPRVRVFGRLAAGANLRQAQAELSAVGRRAAAEFPAADTLLRPQVVPYARSILDLENVAAVGLLSVNVFLLMLLLLVCGNVALLIFARAATREAEIAVRRALGASRGRIVAQLFAEALVLGSLAAAVGLAAAGMALRWWMGVSRAEAGGRLPFWFHEGLSTATVLYAAVLAVLATGVIGVLPALKVTRTGLAARLRRDTAGGGGLRFGGVWTAVIVAQVAVTVAFPASGFFVRQSVARIQSLEVAFPTEEYLSARLDMGGDAESEPGSLGDAARELERRLEADPAVAGVTFAASLPRTYHPQRRVLVEGGSGGAAGSGAAHAVSRSAVAPDFFDVLGTPILAGRGFHEGDLDAGARAVVVNRSFVDGVLGGREAVGRVLRYADGGAGAGDEWYAVVGVVGELGAIAGDLDPRDDAGVYHPVAPGAARPLHVAVHVRGDPAAFAPRLRAAAAAVDPGLRVHDMESLDAVGATLWMEFDFLFRLLVTVSAVALLLSLAGIYAVMSFTVSRRTREIGIRVALGADARRVLAAVFRRPLAQVGCGIATGAALTGALATAATGGLSGGGLALLAGYACVMLAVCLAACVVPTRRALRVHPTQAINTGG